MALASRVRFRLPSRAVCEFADLLWANSGLRISRPTDITKMGPRIWPCFREVRRPGRVLNSAGRSSRRHVAVRDTVPLGIIGVKFEPLSLEPGGLIVELEEWLQHGSGNTELPEEKSERSPKLQAAPPQIGDPSSELVQTITIESWSPEWTNLELFAGQVTRKLSPCWSSLDRDAQFLALLLHRF